MTDLNPIYVTQPNLPPLEEFLPYLEKIWANRILTNGGPFHREFELALSDYLGVQHISLFANGTLALMASLKALNISGEVITTPYSFVATSHTLLWQGLQPVFCDIDPITLNLDPSKIEAAITPNTTAIMPVHCYGQPCATGAIQDIADRYGLKVIYDAAHAFGVQDEGGSILRHGDLSALSFHATKVFNTFEGGAIVCPDAETKQHVDQIKNFGILNEVSVVTVGINGKMSEFNAAFGLLQLKYIDIVIARRQEIDALYRRLLKDTVGIHCLQSVNVKIFNYAYFTILVDANYPLDRDTLYQKLLDRGIHARRYFFPLLSEFPMYRNLPSASCENLPIANKVALNVLCLPIYPALKNAQIEKIADIITSIH